MGEEVKGTGCLDNVLGTKNYNNIFNNNNSILFFFLLLVIIFCNCSLFAESGDSLLFFFLILVVLFTGKGICGRY